MLFAHWLVGLTFCWYFPVTCPSLRYRFAMRLDKVDTRLSELIILTNTKALNLFQSCVGTPQASRCGVRHFLPAELVTIENVSVSNIDTE